MEHAHPDLEKTVSLQATLGYLDFSEGKPDPRFERSISDAYRVLWQAGVDTPWRVLHEQLRAKLDRLKAEKTGGFSASVQAGAVLEIVFDRVLPGYRQHHADLLFHLSDDDLFQPFFVARAVEVVLAQGNPWEETDRIVAGALARLNDFVGYRPLAVLETRPRGEPYDHERVRPIPLFIGGAGVAAGRYEQLLTQALEILKATDASILNEAGFDPELLGEFAIDPRAYDYSHPANRRPNYAFGEWDPHHLDQQGRFRRYVARTATLEALLHRAEHPGEIDPSEALFEAAAVFAGTVLMATGVTGNSPTAYDSTNTLATIMPRIARYRDAFYARLLEKLPEAHRSRLREEASKTRQPFGGARQHLNQYLARERAAQLQHRHLSMLFAEMGYPDASRQQAAKIPAASTRLLSEMHARLTTGLWHAERRNLAAAAALLPEVEDLLHRGIQCGALADPWNILGFQGLFPLDRAREDAVRDNRIDELVLTLERLFDLYARLLSEAAALGEHDTVNRLKPELRRLAAWWDRFASIEVSDVRRLHGAEVATSAEGVADALTLWHDRGQTPDDLAFWRQHSHRFRSPKAFALVVDALLAKEDYRAAMGLLLSWLGRAEQVPLEDGEYSFHARALRWLLAQIRPRGDSPSGAGSESAAPAGARDWAFVKKFFDFLEANAEDYWQVPVLESAEEGPAPRQVEEELFSAAYEGMSYRDSADDDEEGSVAGAGKPAADFDVEWQAERIQKRLAFLATLARLWQIAGRWDPERSADPGHAEALNAWLVTARDNRQKLLELVDAVHGVPVPEPSGSEDSLIEYDRGRILKGQLLFSAIGTALESTLALYALRGALDLAGATPDDQGDEPPWGPAAIRIEQALLKGDTAAAQAALPEFVQHFHREPLLVPSLDHGGEPRQILRVQMAQNVLRALVANLPRLGLLRETYQLLKIAHAMEQAQPAGGRGLTEFSQLFQLGYQAVVRMVVEAAASWGPAEVRNEDLVQLLETMTRPFMALWVEHSQSTHLATLETVRNEEDWRRIREFVQRYGRDLFHARFMTLANLRSILHRGVAAYLDYLREERDPLHPIKLIDDLEEGGDRKDAERCLELILHAIVENYEQYKDYNTSTAQSDYGDNLYMLLDFLLLRTSYERRAWQFQPLTMAHETLVRCGRHGAAVRWQQALAEASRQQADEYLQRLSALEQTHGMSLRTIRDRLEERFVKPLALDRLCALVKPVMHEAHGTRAGRSFARLKRELQGYAETPTGVGLDVPQWLQRLGLEVQRVRTGQKALALLAEDFFRVPKMTLSSEEIDRQLKEWEKPLGAT